MARCQYHFELRTDNIDQLEKFVKAVFTQESYEKDLKDKVKAIRRASDRFDRAASLCSLEHIISTRLDIHENQRLQKQSFEDLFTEFRALTDTAARQGDAINRTISEEAVMMRKVIGMLVQRVAGLEQTSCRFGNSSTVCPDWMDVQPLSPNRAVTGRHSPFLQGQDLFSCCVLPLVSRRDDTNVSQTQEKLVVSQPKTFCLFSAMTNPSLPTTCLDTTAQSPPCCQRQVIELLQASRHNNFRTGWAHHHPVSS